MNAFFDKLYRYDLIRAIVYIIFGLIILIAPRTVFDTIVYLVASYIACLGIISLYTNYQDQKKGYRNVQFISGILLLISAAAILVFASGLLSIIPFFLGILITISGCTRLMANFSQKRSGAPYLIGLIVSFLIIAAGIILVFNPFSTVLFFFQIFGGILLFMGLSDAINHFQRKNA